MTETKSLRMKNPTHPGRFVRTVIIGPLSLSVAVSAKAVRIARDALSRFHNGREVLSPDRLDKAFGADMGRASEQDGVLS